MDRRDLRPGHTPFYWLNLTAYTSVCLVLNVAAGVVALRPGNGG